MNYRKNNQNSTGKSTLEKKLTIEAEKAFYQCMKLNLLVEGNDVLNIMDNSRTLANVKHK